MSHVPARARNALTSRAATLALASRFVDELLSSALQILLPGIRVRLGLSYAGISLLKSLHSYSEAITEPITGLASDLVSRRLTLALAAALLGVGGVVLGLAPSIEVLAVGFVLIGIAGGPLRQTGDIVLVQGRRASAARLAALFMAAGTVGALAGPLAVRTSIWLSIESGTLLVSIGILALAYAAIVACTRFPDPVAQRTSHESFLATLRGNVRAVLSARAAVSWLVYMRVFYVMDAPGSFETIWLSDNAHMDAGAIAVYVAFEMCMVLVGQFVLHRWVHHVPPRRIALVVPIALAAIQPAWFAPLSLASRYAVGGALSIVWSMLWPIARAESLSASPHPGAVTALNSLSGALLPVTLVIGVLAEAIGLTQAMLLFRLGGCVALSVIAWRWLPRD